MSNPKKISGPILHYPGGKWLLAPWIVSHFPKHRSYIEPFFGGGSVFFHKVIAKHEVINDLSGDVVNLFRVARDNGNELARVISLTPWAREEYDLSWIDDTDDPLERARRFLVKVWTAHSGDLANKSGWRNNGKVDVRIPLTESWRKLPARIMQCLDRLQHAQIDNSPAIEVIQRRGGKDTLIYADPPYVRSTRTSDMYQHEMSDDQHVELLAALDSHPGPVVLSGYRCQLYDERLTHWTRIDRGNKAGSGAKRVESLWLNQHASASGQAIMNIAEGANHAGI